MRSRTRRVLVTTVLLACLVAVGSWLIPTEEAEALPPFSRLTDYYSSGTYQTDVGWHFRSCSGGADSEGSTSAFWVREFDYSCVGSTYCCIVCSTGPCPQNVLDAYPCGQC